MKASTFRAAVMANAGGECENPNCDQAADSVHHFLKRSTNPTFATRPENGMAVCGRCHESIELAQRLNGGFEAFYPIDRYVTALGLAGQKFWLRVHIKDRKVKGEHVTLNGFDQLNRAVEIQSDAGLVYLIIAGSLVLDTVSDWSNPEASLLETLRGFSVELDLKHVDSEY